MFDFGHQNIHFRFLSMPRSIIQVKGTLLKSKKVAEGPNGQFFAKRHRKIPLRGMYMALFKLGFLLSSLFKRNS